MMGLVRALVICAVLGLTSGKLHDSRFSISLVKAVGDNVLFNISWDPAPYTELSWEFWQRSLTIISVINGVNSTNPEYTDRITLLEDGSLELRNLIESDSGAYRVSITSTEVPQFNRLFSLYVQQPVSDVQLSASATDFIEWNNSYVTLTCSASGSDLEFAWYNQSSYIGSYYQDYSLYVNRYDSGPYRCEVYNKINKVSSGLLSLTISYGPDVTLTAFPMQHSYDEGSTVTLTCTVESKPEAEISWTRNEALLPLNGTELVLKDLTYEWIGRYGCKAYNRKTDKSYYQTMFIPIKYKPDDTDNGLSPYAILGIVIGISYGGLIIGALTWYICRQRMKAKL